VKILAMMPVDSGLLPGPLLQTGRPTPLYAQVHMHVRLFISSGSFRKGLIGLILGLALQLLS